MNRKRALRIFSGIIIFLIITGALIIRSLTNTGHGKLNIKVALALKIQKHFTPASIKNKQINQVRAAMDKGLTIFSTKPIAFINIKNIYISTASAKIPVRIYTPEGSTRFPIVIYAHGGAWISGSIDTHDDVCRKLSKYTNAVVVSVGYRLAPENPFPAGLNDVYDVLKWAYKNADTISGSKDQIAIAGDSAGGNFAAVIPMISRNENGPHITCQVLVYPSTNIFELNSNSWSYFANGFNLSKEDMEKYISLYVLKKEDRKSPYASPLLAKDFKGLPPALVITAEFDPLRDEGVNTLGPVLTVTSTAVLMNFINFSYGVSNTAIQKVAGSFLNKGISWQKFYVLMLICSLVLFIYLLFMKIPYSQKRQAENYKKSELFKNKMLYLYIGALGFYLAAEYGVGN